MTENSKYYEGDPKMILTENGSDIPFKGGQPTMDRGLENAVMISFFTRPGWWGNKLMRKPEQKIGSNVEEQAQKPINLDAINDMRSAMDRAVEWMTNTRVASEIENRVSNPRNNNLRAVSLIKPPDRDVQLILLNKYGDNWINQKIDPAYLRL